MVSQIIVVRDLGWMGESGVGEWAAEDVVQRWLGMRMRIMWTLR